MGLNHIVDHSFDRMFFTVRKPIELHQQHRKVRAKVVTCPAWRRGLWHFLSFSLAPIVMTVRKPIGLKQHHGKVRAKVLTLPRMATRTLAFSFYFFGANRAMEGKIRALKSPLKHRTSYVR